MELAVPTGMSYWSPDVVDNSDRSASCIILLFGCGFKVTVKGPQTAFTTPSVILVLDFLQLFLLHISTTGADTATAGK